VSVYSTVIEQSSIFGYFLENIVVEKSKLFWGKTPLHNPICNQRLLFSSPKNLTHRIMFSQSS